MHYRTELRHTFELGLELNCNLPGQHQSSAVMWLPRGSHIRIRPAEKPEFPNICVLHSCMFQWR